MLPMAPQDLACRRGDLALGEDAGRDLVEQRLEQVVARLAGDGDVDVGPAERLRREQAAEAGPDDHHAVPCAGGVRLSCHEGAPSVGGSCGVSLAATSTLGRRAHAAAARRRQLIAITPPGRCQRRSRRGGGRRPVHAVDTPGLARATSHEL